MKEEEYIDNGHPGEFPKPEDGWEHSEEQWIDNGQPGEFPKPEDGWL